MGYYCTCGNTTLFRRDEYWTVEQTRETEIDQEGDEQDVIDIEDGDSTFNDCADEVYCAECGETVYHEDDHVYSVTEDGEPVFEETPPESIEVTDWKQRIEDLK